MSMPDDWKLLSIERTFDCRCAIPAAPPARAHNALTSCAAWPHRCCNLDGKDAVDMENGCITEQEMCANVEYLVLGHFERKQGDTKGTHTMLWLALADFDHSAVSNDVVDAKLDAWEVQGARIRKEAQRVYSVRLKVRRDDCETDARWAIRGFLGFLGFPDSQDSWWMVH